MAADPAFVDTNVLVYATQKRSPFHARATAALDEARSDGAALWISRQVLREYLATVTRPQSQPAQAPLTMAEAVTDARGFERDFNVAEDGPESFGNLLELLGRVRVAGKQLHDANLVATMLAYDIKRLLTFNLPDFQRFAGLVELVAP